VASAQLIDIGPPDPHACEHWKVKPNLLVSTKSNIRGEIRDQTGAPMPNLRIELRMHKSDEQQIFFRKTLTNANGRFSFGSVPPGNYRFVAFARGFRQPGPMSCNRETCELRVVPEVAPTDAFPDSVCPPK
jgi:hypothetical protein